MCFFNTLSCSHTCMHACMHTHRQRLYGKLPNTRLQKGKMNLLLISGKLRWTFNIYTHFLRSERSLVTWSRSAINTEPMHRQSALALFMMIPIKLWPDWAMYEAIVELNVIRNRSLWPTSAPWMSPWTLVLSRSFIIKNSAWNDMRVAITTLQLGLQTIIVSLIDVTTVFQSEFSNVNLLSSTTVKVQCDWQS